MRARATGCAGSGSSRRDSQANFVWFDLGEDRSTSPRSCAGWPSAASSCAPAAALGREGALRVTFGTQAENERFLEALARCSNHRTLNLLHIGHQMQSRHG